MGGRGNTGSRGQKLPLEYTKGIGRIENPIPVFSQNEEALEDLNDLWMESTLEGAGRYKEIEIPVSTLTTVQPWVEKSTLSYMEKNIGNKPIQGVAVVEYNGKYVIMDGNHRASYAKLRGDKRIKIELYHL